MDHVLFSQLDIVETPIVEYTIDRTPSTCSI